MSRGGQITRFGDIFEPDEAQEPILSRGVRGALQEWLEEIWAEQELVAVGILPRKRAMFDGPPGVGKTTLAHHLSARLGLPMLAVRPECVISKWVGETGQNIGQMFDMASDSENPIVLFIDEFDAISRQRRRSEQAADDSRNEEVNTLLQRIEQHKGFIIAATNFGAHIDQAIWRRFDIHLTLEMPGQRERELIVSRYLEPFGLPAHSLRALSEALDIASPALIRKFCEGLKRQFILGPRLNYDMSRDATITRVLASIQPHPDIGKPRLWSHGENDKAIHSLPWPIQRADEIKSAPVRMDELSGIETNIVQLGRAALHREFGGAH